MDKYPKYIGCDFDATISEYHGWKGPTDLGKPIPEMVRKIKEAMSQGSQVWIFTARVNPGGHEYKEALEATQAYLAIAEWCVKVFGELLPITHEKNKLWQSIYDDRAIQVLPNSGILATDLLDAVAKRK